MSMGSNPIKTWAWGAGILGIILVVCGFLSQTRQDCEKLPGGDNTAPSSPFTWAAVIIGFIMLLAGFMTLMKMSKKAGVSALPPPMTGGDMPPPPQPGDMPPGMM